MSKVKVRELGPLEHFRAVLHDLKFHNNVTVMARLTGSRVSLDTLKRTTYNACSHAISRHPALRVGIMDQHEGSARPCFVHIPEIDLTRMVSVETSPLSSPDTQATDEALGHQNSIGFDSQDLPLWRLVVVQYNISSEQCMLDVAFTWHHAIGDGKSGLAALQSFIQGLEQGPNVPPQSLHQPSESEIHSIIHTTDAMIKPPLESIMRMPVSWTAYIHGLGKRFPYLKLHTKSVPKWSGKPYSFGAPITTDIKTVQIPARDTKTLLARCRQARVTLTPLIQTLVGKTILEVVPTALYLRCSIAISLRRFFEDIYHINEDDMGLYISTFFLDVFREDFNGSDSRFWDQVRKSAGQFQREITKGDLDIDSGSLRSSTDYQSALSAQRGQQREKSYGITNLGLFRLDGMAQSPNQEQNHSHDRTWELNEVLFSQSCHANGAAIQFCIVSNEGGPLNIVLSSQRGVVDQTTIERVAARLREQLLAIAAGVGTSLLRPNTSRSIDAAQHTVRKSETL